MQFGYQCEDCEEAMWPATTRAELSWLRRREHLVREVAKHLQSGVDMWMTEALEFLDHHSGHSVIVVSRR